MTTNVADYKAFAADINRLRREVEPQIGSEDVRQLKRLCFFSRGLELTGRLLIHFSPGPLSFGLGVLTLAAHKQLHGSEIGHAVLHGAYDKLPGATWFQSKTYWWETPIDEESWRHGHNVAHHQYTNVVGKDPDCKYGRIRLNEHVPWEPANENQHLHPLIVWPAFKFSMAAHFTGLIDVYLRKTENSDVLPDRKMSTIVEAHRKWLRKTVPYYGKEYVLFPLLAGAMFWKVMLGNWMAEVLRSLYSAATIFTGHVGEDTSSYPANTRASSRGEWYAMQVRSSNNFEVPGWMSILCGGLDYQIEHHLFPRWPPRRLRQVAPRVREICERHGIEYRTAPWGTMLRRVFRQIRVLGRAPA